MHCADCGTKLSDGMCPNCHEELFIATFQGADMDYPLSEDFSRKVDEQAAIVGRTRSSAKEEK